MIKKVVITSLVIFAQVGAETLEEYYTVVKDSPTPAVKQMVICEREAQFLLKNPEECIKSAEMLLQIKKKVTKNFLLRCEIWGLSEDAYVFCWKRR